MLIDITLKIIPEMIRNAPGNEAKHLTGHLGTHFDVMNKEFPLEYTTRSGIVFDVAHIRDRDICSSDIDPDAIQPGMFVAFRTGYIHEVAYGCQEYFGWHPQLSDELIDTLLEKQVSIIGIDCSGIRRGKEHIPADQRCADHGTFVVENLVNLHQILAYGAPFTAHTYPMPYTDLTGLPCRVIAEV